MIVAIVVMREGQSKALGAKQYLPVVHRARNVERLAPGVFEIEVPADQLADLQRDPAIAYVRSVVSIPDPCIREAA